MRVRRIFIRQLSFQRESQVWKLGHRVLPSLANTNFAQTKFSQHHLWPKPWKSSRILRVKPNFFNFS